MIGNALEKIIGKTIEKIVTFDPYGYDRGFILVCTDETEITIESRKINLTGETRIDISEIKEENNENYLGI